MTDGTMGANDGPSVNEGTPDGCVLTGAIDGLLEGACVHNPHVNGHEARTTPLT